MAHLVQYRMDPEHYIAYYQNQAGNGLPGYMGSGVMYGSNFSGIGGVFKNLFRMAMPFLRRGFSIAKPHLKAAAKNIVSDVVTTALTKSYNTDNNNGQNGNGLMVMTRRRVKPPGTRMRRGSGHPVKKTRRHGKKRSFARRTQRTRVKRVKKTTKLKRPLNTIF